MCQFSGDFFGPNLPKNGSRSNPILVSKFQKPKSAFEISAFNVCQFSVTMDSFKIFSLHLVKLANYLQYFGFNNVEGVAESWVETEMSWVRVDGGGWSWVEVGERFTNTQFCL